MSDRSITLEGTGQWCRRAHVAKASLFSFPETSGEDSMSSSAGWAASVSLAAAATDKSLQKHQRTVPSKRTCWVLSSGSSS